MAGRMNVNGLAAPLDDPEREKRMPGRDPGLPCTRRSAVGFGGGLGTLAATMKSEASPIRRIFLSGTCATAALVNKPLRHNECAR
jgi:hypothetical protein